MLHQKQIRRRITKSQLRNWIAGYLFLLPWLIGMIFLMLYQAGQCLSFSFCNVSISNGISLDFIGLGNYTDVFLTSTSYLLGLGEFVILTLIRTPIIISFSLLMALLINRPFRGRAIYRMLLFLPVLITTGAVMTILTNQGLMSMPNLDIDALTANFSSVLPAWLTNVVSTFLSSLMTMLWNSGVQILLFLSGLQKVSSSMYEAAKIDGASAWECLWKITLPLLKPLILLTTIFTIVSLSSQASTTAVIGLSAQRDGTIISMIVNAMYGLDLKQGYGYASAMAWIYLVVIAMLLLIAWLLLKPEKRVGRNEYSAYRRK